MRLTPVDAGTPAPWRDQPHLTLVTPAVDSDGAPILPVGDWYQGVASDHVVGLLVLSKVSPDTLELTVFELAADQDVAAVGAALLHLAIEASRRADIRRLVVVPTDSAGDLFEHAGARAITRRSTHGAAAPDDPQLYEFRLQAHADGA